MHYQGAINQNKETLMQDIKDFENFCPNNDILCYPFGQYNDNIEECFKESNYKMAFKYFLIVKIIKKLVEMIIFMKFQDLMCLMELVFLNLL